jgi:two-component sensor histidine kinase
MNDKKGVLSKPGLRDVTNRFLVVFLPLMFLIIVVTAMVYHTETVSKKTIVRASENNIVSLQMQIIASDFQSVVSDLMILSENHELKAFLESGEAMHRSILGKEFLILSKQKGLYDQIRFLDEKGMEVVRINFNDGRPEIVSENRLQFKGTRYYFQDTFQLSRGDVFVSPLDLNIEKGKIEHPLKPMIRFGTPVFDNRGKKRGIVLLNYFGAKMIHNLNRAHINPNGDLMLLNSDGFWLKGPSPEAEWGFMYGDKEQIFGNAFPQAWQRIKSAESGQFDNAEGLFTFNTIYPLSEAYKSSTGSGKAFDSSIAMITANDYYWKIVSRVSPKTLKIASQGFLNKLLILVFTLLVLLAISSFFMARAKIRKQAEARIKASLHEKELLLKEIHHRVKNNMQIISSILTLQSVSTGNEKLTSIFNQCQDRINSMALVHEKLYQTEDLSDINFKEYIETLTKSLFDSYKKDKDEINLKIDVEDVFLDIDTAIPLGLVINELVTNSLKHAFKKKGKGKISIFLQDINENKLKLRLTDNGIGFPKGFDFRNTDSLGFQLITLLAENQLKGKIDLHQNEGTEFRLTFKRKKVLEKNK